MTASEFLEKLSDRITFSKQLVNLRNLRNLLILEETTRTIMNEKVLL